MGALGRGLQQWTERFEHVTFVGRAYGGEFRYAYKRGRDRGTFDVPGGVFERVKVDEFADPPAILVTGLEARTWIRRAIRNMIANCAMDRRLR